MNETSDLSLRGKPQGQRLFSRCDNQAAGWTTEQSCFVSQQEEGIVLTSILEGTKQLRDEINLLCSGYRKYIPRVTWAGA